MNETNRYHEEWTDLLSDHLAGDLDERTRSDLETHLAACAECRRVLGELREVVTGASALGGLQPPRDLWPGIASAIAPGVPEGRPGGDAVVLELPTAHGAGRVGIAAHTLRARVGLAAAAAGLVALTATTTWWLAAARPGPGATVARVTPSGAAGPVIAADAGAPSDGLAAELAALEAALDVARTVLDPSTVLVLERNLGVIEQAIADSRQALAVDPGNAFLSEHLEGMYQRKLLYLQDAVRAVEWSG
jgi:hypothetical protein